MNARLPRTTLAFVVTMIAVALVVIFTYGGNKAIAGNGTMGTTSPVTHGVVFDNVRMEEDIQSQSVSAGMPLHNVICPANEPVRTGVVFNCHAGDVLIQIVAISNNGDYKWNPEPGK